MATSKLAFYRRKKGLTQEQLAELSGVTTRTIQRVENGAVVPHIQTLKILARCLDIETELLMDSAEGNITPVEAKPKTNLAPLFHLSALLGLFLPVLNLAFPFVLWLVKKDENPEYDRQGRLVLNFQLTGTIVFFPAIILMVVFFPVGFPLAMATYAYLVVMSIVNLYRSMKLLPIKYPLSYRFLNIRAVE